MSSSVNRLAFIKVYKDLQRIATQFPQYSYRNFARRRIRDYFEANKSANASNQSALYEEALNAVQSLKRQVQVSKQYPYRPLVIEQKKN